MASKDENGEIKGLSIIGYVVLVRHNRGQSNVSALSHSEKYI